MGATSRTFGGQSRVGPFRRAAARLHRTDGTAIGPRRTQRTRRTTFGVRWPAPRARISWEQPLDAPHRKSRQKLRGQTCRARGQEIRGQTSRAWDQEVLTLDLFPLSGIPRRLAFRAVSALFPSPFSRSPVAASAPPNAAVCWSSSPHARATRARCRADNGRESRVDSRIGLPRRRSRRAS